LSQKQVRAGLSLQREKRAGLFQKQAKSGFVSEASKSGSVFEARKSGGFSAEQAKSVLCMTESEA